MEWYLINRTARFTPETCTLSIQGKQETDFVLNTPAAACLVLLLQRRGEIVGKEEFYKTVWHEKGNYVTANTFYQNISLIRKGFKAVGLEPGWVETVPGKGIRLGRALNVILKSDSYNDEPLETKTQPPLIQESIIDNGIKGSSASVTNAKCREPRSIRSIAIYTSFPIILICGLLWLSELPPKDYFANYSLISEKNKCKYYADNSIGYQSRYDAYIARATSKCQEEQVHYLSISRSGFMVSDIACYPSVNHLNHHCVSTYEVKYDNQE
ncbi:MAG: winged helix-turn-helix domain-containing protein [Enterobacterales bacterium]|uniref:winged helix-turn-helix domain-containing protein n=1 Tax=Serratia sp. (in: enterobacteria) TaxID=616 RepID=UPI003F37C305